MHYECMMNNDMLTLVPLMPQFAQEARTIHAKTLKRNTKAVGIVSELVAMERFSRAGFFLYLPFGDAAPADLVLIDRANHVFRIQVKTGRLRNGAVLFSCVSNHGHRKMPPTPYVGSIDAFGVYCPNNDELYVVPIDASAVTRAYGTLRITPTSINLTKPIHWAKDYRFDVNSPGTLLKGAVTNGAAGED